MFQGLRGHQVGTTHLGAPGEGARPGGLCPTRGLSLVGLGSRNSYYWYKKSSQSFVTFRELLFLHKKQHRGSSVENSVSLGLVSFKSCKLESKTRGKASGKIDTLEKHQGVTAEEAMPASVGAVIRLQRIYNFILFHAIILSVLDVNGLIFTLLYYFWD